MLLLIFSQQTVNLVSTGEQQAVHPVGFRAITCPHTSTTFIGFLIPITQTDKNIHALTYHLTIPSIFELDKILFGIINFTSNMQAIAS